MYFFFFKQKTAYEMRISDWSSDVCSSDLGVLFLLQNLATVLFGIDFRNLGLRLPILEFADMYISFARLLAFGAALLGMAALYLFLTRTFMGTAIRAIAQDREIMVLMGVHSRRVYLMTSAICGAPAGLARCPPVLPEHVPPGTPT